MAEIHGGFDANQVEPKTPFEVIPNGKQVAAIVESGNKKTQDQSGEYLSFTFEILEGPYKGRKLWKNLNLKNKNAQAVAIARAELSSICRATGVMQPKDSCELHAIPIVINVKVKKRKDTGDMQNEIVAYERRGAASPPTQSAGDVSAPPWARTSAK